jgi:hypothetical protein
MPTMERWSAVALEEEQFNAHCPTQKAKRWQRLLSLIAALPSLSYSDVASPILALVVSAVLGDLSLYQERTFVRVQSR